MSSFRREVIPVSDLVKVDPPGHPDPVVLKIGGPVMRLLSVAGGHAEVEWMDWDEGDLVYRLHRDRYPVVCLCRLAPLVVDDEVTI